MRRFLLSLLGLSYVASAAAENTAGPNRYTQTNLVANRSDYAPTLAVDENFINAWGMAIRPAGAGGHFWVLGRDISFEYVGDVRNAADPALRSLHTDGLKIVRLPVGGTDQFATGVAFSGSQKNFKITQKVPGKVDISAPAKFLFASDGGIISGWTERKNANGTTDYPADAKAMIDLSAQGAQFFGLAMNADYSRLYVADFGASPTIHVFGGTFKPLPIRFEMPFDDNRNGRVDAGEYAPFNIQNLTNPAGENHLFVTYAKTQPCPADAVSSGQCKAGAVYAGEEDTSRAGSGRLAEFTPDGKLVRVWVDGGHLNAPWGLAFAPKDFGALSGALLVANFGDGTIAAFDASTHHFVDMVRDQDGKPIQIDKIWGLLFGNGESLGDRNALYFSAGPRDEQDGLFGAIRTW